MLVFDGHNDVLLALAGEVEPFLEGRPDGHVDLPRALAGGLAGGLFAAFVRGGELDEPPAGTTSYALPLADPVDPGAASAAADGLAGTLARLEEAGGVRVVRSTADLELDAGSIAAVLHLEGAEAVRAPEELDAWFDRGVRSLGIVWSRRNAYGEGVPFRFPASPDTGPGLTPAGHDLVRACNRLGVLVDVSHLNLRGFYDVAETSEAPLVASHSNAHALCASTRNLLDEQLDEIASTSGLVGVNFAVSFLRRDGMLETDTSVEAIVRHVDYLADRMGVDCVAFGSDFDGAQVPDAVGDASGLPVLIDALRDHGATEEEVAKIAHGNWLRVLREAWAG